MVNDPLDNKRCRHVKADGERCKAPPLRDGSGYCFHHAPDKAKERAEARRRGGHENARKAVLPAAAADAPLETVADVTRLLGETINQVRTGALDCKVANCVGYLAGVFLKALETGALEERLTALEAMGADDSGRAAA